MNPRYTRGTIPSAFPRSTDDAFRPDIDSIPALVWNYLPDGHVESANQRWIGYTGLRFGEIVGKGWMAAVHPDDLPEMTLHLKSLLGSGNPCDPEARRRRSDGTYRWHLFRTAPSSDDTGAVEMLLCTGTDIEIRKRSEALPAGEKRILEKIAKGQPLARTLEAVCHSVGEISPGSPCSILLADWIDLRFAHGAAPGLPQSYQQAMDGRIFETSTDACARAARQGQRVIVPDIAADLVRTDRPDLPLEHGLKACWSAPIFSQDGRVIGLFATCSRSPSMPTTYQLHFIDHLTDIAGIAIERDRSAAAPHASEHLARGQLEALAGSLAALSRESEPEKFLDTYCISQVIGWTPASSPFGK